MIATVTQAESNLLTLARAAVGVIPAGDVIRLLVTSVAPPPKLGPSARRVLSDTLSRGTMLSLARQGGWRVDAGKRLWERHQAPALEFTANIVRLLQWMLRTPMAEAEAGALQLKGALTVAEEVVVVQLFERLKGTGCEWALARQPAIRTSALMQLAHAAELGRDGLDAVAPLDLKVHAVAIDGLRELLARSWLGAEKQKRDVISPEQMIQIGDAQTRVLDHFFDVVNKGDQRRLSTFLIDGAIEWLAKPRTADDYVRSLGTDAPLRDRTEARRQAGAFMRSLSRLRAWDQEHRAVRFIDDGYEMAQALVKDWERMGENNFNAAERLVGELDALPT